MNKRIKKILTVDNNCDYKKLSIEDILLLKDYIINLQESEAYYYGQYKDYKSRYKEIERLNKFEIWIEEQIKISQAHNNQLGVRVCNICKDKLNELKGSYKE